MNNAIMTQQDSNGARRAAPGVVGSLLTEAPPCCNTGGKYNTPKANQCVKVDWLNCTFQQPESRTIKQIVAILGIAIGRELTGVSDRGIFGFERSVRLFVKVASDEYPIGCLAYGGASQKGRIMFQLTGHGCTVVRTWDRLKRLLRALDARITRCDLAADFMDGEYTVDDAVKMYADGEFNNGGRKPSSSVAGDWLNRVNGRTLYVGKSTNGKLLRVYEKGIQLGNHASPWVRFEVQFGNRDRVIPLDVLTARAEYLAGSYPALATMLKCAALKIVTTVTEGLVSLAHLAYHAVRSYGKVIGTLAAHLDCAASELVEVLSIAGAPRRLKPDAVAANLTWEQFLPQLRSKSCV